MHLQGTNTAPIFLLLTAGIFIRNHSLKSVLGDTVQCYNSLMNYIQHHCATKYLAWNVFSEQKISVRHTLSRIKLGRICWCPQQGRKDDRKLLEVYKSL